MFRRAIFLHSLHNHEFEGVRSSYYIASWKDVLGATTCKCCHPRIDGGTFEKVVFWRYDAPNELHPHLILRLLLISTMLLFRVGLHYLASQPSLLHLFALPIFTTPVFILFGFLGFARPIFCSVARSSNVVVIDSAFVSILTLGVFSFAFLVLLRALHADDATATERRLTYLSLCIGPRYVVFVGIGRGVDGVSVEERERLGISEMSYGFAYEFWYMGSEDGER